jgi:hydrogenase maturation protein HypF
LKNAVAFSVGQQVFISQHIGDLETEQSFTAFRQVIADFQKLYEVKPEIVAADLHPDYLSTKFAQETTAESTRCESSPAGRRTFVAYATKVGAAQSPRYVGVQHHIAHVLSCMAENELEPPVLGVSWDGTGYGLDGTIWGGEFFLVTGASLERIAHLRPFRLPGGDKAVKEPRRTALGLLHEMFGTEVFERKNLPTLMACSPAELATIKTMLERGLNSPWCSSAGRLFDAVASLIGLRQQIRFEGQAAMELEFAVENIRTDEFYELRIADGGFQNERAPDTERPSAIGNQQSAIILDWSPMIETILADAQRGVSLGVISAKFHNALAEGIVTVAKRVGQSRVALSGGCFQNRYLTERTVRRLRAEGFRPYWHQRVPPNDGGISLGQVVAALRQRG